MPSYSVLGPPCMAKRRTRSRDLNMTGLRNELRTSSTIAAPSIHGRGAQNPAKWMQSRVGHCIGPNFAKSERAGGRSVSFPSCKQEIGGNSTIKFQKFERRLEDRSLCTSVARCNLSRRGKLLQHLGFASEDAQRRGRNTVPEPAIG